MDCKNIRKSSSSHRTWKYEVFLSFRGEDTRNNFTDHLFTALKRKGVSVFKDDKELRKGKAISSELLTAIEESQISIVIFSRTYAASTWCLEELAKIAECVEIHAQNALPVFYDVNPSEVRKQSGNYKEFFVNHEERFKENLDKVKRWRLALSKVGGLSGWDVQNKPQAKEIEKIVMEVINKLGHKFSSLADDLVGIQSRAEALQNLLNKGSKDDVQVVGICGMPGIGKTTLAAVVYDRISHQFDACSFLVDVSRVFKNHGLVHLQEQLLCETLNEKNLKIWDFYKGTNLISTRLTHLKALIVLDNVDEPKQLENLVGKPDWFGLGSRIIIITRDEHILKEYGVDNIYKVEQWNDVEVTHLLCRKAFKSDEPRQDYKELTCRVVEYVNGLPLAAKVLGSFLFGRDVLEWEDALDRFQEHPGKEIMEVLQTSFDGLEPLDKEIFLDIACFFHGMCEHDVKRILSCCEFNPKFGISVLIDKSLLIILGEKIYMHDLLQKLGRNIVRKNPPNEPRKWSRLWLYKNFYHVMIENTVTEDVKAIVLNQKDEPDSLLRADALSNISHLRLLIFQNVKFSGSLRFLSNKLKYLEWHDYPFAYLPSSFQPDTLVELILPNSYIKQLWVNKKVSRPLLNLKSLDLRRSQNLNKLSDFELFPNLERLNLEGCTSLWQVNESIGVLSKLRYLNLNDCKNLVNLPHCISSLCSLETLCLSGCSKLKKQLKETRQQEELDQGETTRQSRMSIVQRSFRSLVYFFSARHKGAVGLSLASLPGLRSLRSLDISYCHLSEIPPSLGSLHHLESLDLSGNMFQALPSINKLSKLNYLSFSHNKKLQSLPELPSSMDCSSEEGSNKPVWDTARSGLHVLNCPNLTEIEDYSLWALAWLIKTINQNPSSLSWRYDDFVVPGSEIPWWFSHQSLTYKICVPIPPNVREGDSDFVGIILSVVFVTCDLDDPEYIDGKEVIDSIPYISCVMNDFGWIPKEFNLEKEPLTVGLDHLWLGFWPREEPQIKRQLLTKEGLSLAFASGGGLEVKHCGVHWVFKQDLHKLHFVSHKNTGCRSSLQVLDDALELSDSEEAENMSDSKEAGTCHTLKKRKSCQTLTKWETGPTLKKPKTCQIKKLGTGLTVNNLQLTISTSEEAENRSNSE